MLKLLTWIWNLARRQRKARCTCVLTELVGLRGIEYSRERNCPEHGDAALINSGRCPDCRGTSFTLEPEFGSVVGRRMTCDTCTSQFLVEVVGEINPIKIIYWDRITA